ncbi:fungal-specific transcription factor domain-containing protein [Talaromyces proteolyticus]|uniref:Fungal-specific transcription factor domain-containing protein n=1 Tax=Talaromyces proteolyticus TaxID=1131652 RepID=A0AAD4KLB8_9EURO|nr:fungal-specific transcription factor domain-containing protein [Talaromyces proteolyticus]KAH8691881.1 fungal-specific transcription factor domain-containing protein [Talaromyces proteolyticus]
MSTGRTGSSSNSGRSRKHATTACDYCRQRKVKCDGKETQCSNCENHGFECTYRSDPDKRKGPRPILSRVQALEQILVENGIPIPSCTPTSTEQSTVHKTYLTPAQPIAASHLQSFSTGSPTMEECIDTHLAVAISADPFVTELEQPMHCLRNDEAISWTWDDDGNASTELFDRNTHDNILVPADVFRDHQPYVSANGLANDLHIHAKPNSVSEDGLDSLAMRVGSLQVAEDGELRFFGATSNLHLLQQWCSNSSHHGNMNTTRMDTQSILEKAGLGHKIPRELEDHLIKLYLTWEDPATHIVDGQLFFEARNQVLDHPQNMGRMPSYYSELLVSAMCAVGVAFTTRIIPELPSPMAEFFSSRAKALLEVEMDRPSVSTVQALVVLSAHEAAFTRDARGWLYSGMAIRLAVDLGLHLDVESYVATGMMSRAEADVRRTTFFGVYILDIYWSYYMGRPPMMNAVKATISIPEIDDDLKSYRQWQSYMEEPYITMDPGPSWTATDAVWTQCKYTISLCGIMESLREALYTPIPMSPSTRILHVTECTENLARWFDELPPSLRIDLDDSSKIHLPHIIQLNMQYHEILIFANHPFAINTRLNIPHMQDIAHICRTSASAIAQLLKVYERQWGLFRVNIQAVKIVFSATLVHLYTIYDNTSTIDHANQALEDLKICCHALCQFSRSWHNALRALQFIVLLKEDMKKKAASTQLQSSIFGNHEANFKWQMLEVALKEVKETQQKRQAEFSNASWMEEWSVLSSSLKGDPFACTLRK